MFRTKFLYDLIPAIITPLIWTPNCAHGVLLSSSRSLVLPFARQPHPRESRTRYSEVSGNCESFSGGIGKLETYYLLAINYGSRHLFSVIFIRGRVLISGIIQKAVEVYAKKAKNTQVLSRHVHLQTSTSSFPPLSSHGRGRRDISSFCVCYTGTFYESPEIGTG